MDGGDVGAGESAIVHDLLDAGSGGGDLGRQIGQSSRPIADNGGEPAETAVRDQAAGCGSHGLAEPKPYPSLLSHALAAIAREVEEFVAAAGWDQQPQLFALVATPTLLASQPELAGQLDVDAALTPVAQEALPEGELDAALAGIEWPEAVAGCALVQEIVVLPPTAQADLGGGSLVINGQVVSSTGRNRIRGNNRADVRNLRIDYTLKADANCWDHRSASEITAASSVSG